MVDTCHYSFVKPMEYTTLRVKPNANCGLQVINMCQCRFLASNKCPAMEWDFDSGKAVCMWKLVIYGKSLLSSI